MFDGCRPDCAGNRRLLRRPGERIRTQKLLDRVVEQFDAYFDPEDRSLSDMRGRRATGARFGAATAAPPVLRLPGSILKETERFEVQRSFPGKADIKRLFPFEGNDGDQRHPPDLAARFQLHLPDQDLSLRVVRYAEIAGEAASQFQRQKSGGDEVEILPADDGAVLDAGDIASVLPLGNADLVFHRRIAVIDPVGDARIR